MNRNWQPYFAIFLFLVTGCNKTQQSEPSIGTDNPYSQANTFDYKVIETTIDIPDFELTNQHGQKASLTDYLNNGKSSFLQFIFTSCPTICPVLSSHFAAFQKHIITNSAFVQLISISIDPEYDTPERLKDYGSKFNAAENWIFLTGKKENIRNLQYAFESYQGNKMDHKPITFFKPNAAENWIIFDGFIGGDELWKEYQRQIN